MFYLLNYLKCPLVNNGSYTLSVDLKIIRSGTRNSGWQLMRQRTAIALWEANCAKYLFCTGLSLKITCHCKSDMKSFKIISHLNHQELKSSVWEEFRGEKCLQGWLCNEIDSVGARSIGVPLSPGWEVTSCPLLITKVFGSSLSALTRTWGRGVVPVRGDAQPFLSLLLFPPLLLLSSGWLFLTTGGLGVGG